MDGFEGRRIVVTGGAGGIGRATARLLHEAGAKLVLVDRDRDSLDAFARSLSGSIAHVSDLADPRACAAVLDAAGGSLHGLVHLAATIEVESMEPGDRGAYERTIASNLTNAYDLAAAFPERAADDGPARMVFASSLAFRRGSFESPAYSAAKGGIAGLVRALARRFAPHILVNGVAPGVIRTGMTEAMIERRGERLLAEIPLRRFGDPQDVAGVIAFLLGPWSSYMTGQILNVDGGTIHG